MSFLFQEKISIKWIWFVAFLDYPFWYCYLKQLPFCISLNVLSSVIYILCQIL